jgi:alginate O-acetyltransferase complex protein AlgI
MESGFPGIKGSESKNEFQLSKRKDIFEDIKSLIRHVYTLVAVLVGWVFFRAGSFSEGMWYLKTMFGRALGNTPGYSVMWYLDGWTAFILVMGIVLSLAIPGIPVRKTGFEIDRILNLKVKKCCDGEVQGSTDVKSESNSAVWTFTRDIALILLLLLSVMRIVSGTYNPFIYFQF